MCSGTKAVFSDKYLRDSKNLLAIYINGWSQNVCRWCGKIDDLHSR